jgi:N-acetylneuraminic acid mutarotase
MIPTFSSPASRCHASAPRFVLGCLAVMVTLSAVACEDEQEPTAPPAAEPRSPAAFDRDALRAQPDDVTVHDAWFTRSPIPRAGYAIRAGTLNGIVYVVSDNATGGRSVQAYNVATNSWSDRRALPSPRHAAHGVSAINGRLYVTGGINNIEAPTKTVYMYNPTNNAWVKKADLPTASFCGAQGVIGGRLYVYAGCTRSGAHHFWRYDPATNTWVTRRAPPTVHQYPAAGVIEGKFYLAGGSSNSGDNLADNLALEVYNPATNSWVTRAPLPAGQAGSASGVLNKKLYVATGTSGGVLSTRLRVYNPATNAWTTKAWIPTARWGSAGATADGRLFVIAGLGSAGTSSEVEAYTP